MEFYALLERVMAVVNSDELEWKQKYLEVFRLYEESGVSFKWYDPDKSYEGDVMAFVKGLEEAAVRHAKGKHERRNQST